MNAVEVKETIITSVSGLPTLPDVVHKILSLVDEENATAGELGDLISHDPAISSRLLKVANSAYYGCMKDVATVRQAIIVLGFEEVKSLSLGIGVFDAMTAFQGDSGFDIKDFWLHAAGTALATRSLCEKRPGIDSGVAFTGGLLHDIGKLVLSMFFSKDYAAVLKKVGEDAVSTAAAERDLLGFTHADAGMWLCDRWKFPAALSRPIGGHHDVGPVSEEHKEMTAVVHVADSICRQAGIGGEGGGEPIQAAALDLLALLPEDLDAMAEQVQEEEHKATSFLSAIE